MQRTCVRIEVSIRCNAVDVDDAPFAERRFRDGVVANELRANPFDVQV
jgi:hypothetical protein